MYHITYLSDNLKVKGYLCFPHGFDLPITELHNFISQFFETHHLPVTKIASAVDPDTQTIHIKKWPVFIYCRGGIGKVGRVKTEWLEQFSQFGHIVFAPCYRGNEDGEGRDEFGGDDQEDVTSAYRLLESFPFVDSERMTLMGFSRGSINATQTAITIPSVHRLVLWGGVTSLIQTYEERVDLRKMLKRVIGGTPTKKPESYQLRSPLLLAEHIRCPVLVMHGTKDEQVDYSHGNNLYNKLQSLDANVELHSYEGYGHHLPYDVHELAIERMFNWIELFK